MNRADELQFMYDELKAKLADADGSGAASVVRELRILSDELERIAAPVEESKLDELAKKRASTGDRRPPARRRKSG